MSPSTPVSRRQKRAAETLGSPSPGGSPGAKRPALRKVVSEPPADQAPLTNDVLTKVVHKLHLQSVEDEPFIAQMVDAVSDHAMRINQLTLKTSESEDGTETKFKQVHDILKAIDAKVEKNARICAGQRREGQRRPQGIGGHCGRAQQRHPSTSH